MALTVNVRSFQLGDSSHFLVKTALSLGKTPQNCEEKPSRHENQYFAGEKGKKLRIFGKIKGANYEQCHRTAIKQHADVPKSHENERHFIGL